MKRKVFLVLILISFIIGYSILENIMKDSQYLCTFPDDYSTSIFDNNIPIREDPSTFILNFNDLTALESFEDEGWQGGPVTLSYFSSENIDNANSIFNYEYTPYSGLRVRNNVFVYDSTEEAKKAFDSEFWTEKSKLDRFKKRLKIGDEACSLYKSKHRDRAFIAFRENNMIVEVSVEKEFMEDDYDITKEMIEGIASEIQEKIKAISTE